MHLEQRTREGGIQRKREGESNREKGGMQLFRRDEESHSGSGVRYLEKEKRKTRKTGKIWLANGKTTEGERATLPGEEPSRGTKPVQQEGSPGV